MADVCGVSFGACLVRVTRLDVNGNVIAGDNSYVSDAPVSVGVNPNIETGQNFSVRNGCGCKIASRKFPDTFNFLDLTLSMAQMEPTLIAFLTGSALITNGADTVGWAGASALACDEQSPKVAFEFWAENGVGSGLNATYPYWHWVIPASTWVLGDNTFEEGPAQPTLTGASQTNGNWGEGPYGDGPPDGEDISEYGVWATDDDLPTAACAAQAVTAVS
jgi:hypothetical protein